MSARYHNYSERLKVRDRLRYNDRHVLDRLGHRRQSAFDRLSETYSPSTTKFRPDKTSPKDRSHYKSCPHRRDSSNGDRSQSRDCSRGVEESYENSHSSYGTNHGYRYRDRDRSRRVKRRMDRAARVWFDELSPESIDSYKDLKTAFLAYFMQQKKYVKDPVEIHNIKQKDRETIKDFMERFKVETGRMKGAPECKLSYLIKEIKQERDQSKVGKKEAPVKDKPMAIYMIQSWQRMTRQKVTQSFGRVREITFPSLATSSGTVGPLVIEAKIGEHIIQHMLLVTIGDADHSTRAWMNFMIVRSLSPYNGIIGRPRIKEIQAVPSTAHRMLKFIADRGIVTIRSTILIPAEWPRGIFTRSAKENGSGPERARPSKHRAVEGMFLGYMITSEGIKPCPDKTEAVLQLPSPLTIKEVQSLNGKLASLNRFLFKSVEKSLPLFKTLKKCIKKSEFHWTSKVEQAFKQLKQHLSELPLLVAPTPKEELIVYMPASYGAISTFLMTERGMVQMLVYFVTRVLQGPELNYTPMEKLVLSLVFATKRLQRYFQAHPIAVITDQPIKQIMSRPDVAGRLQKWSVILGEHNITYRPRTSVKGQVLAGFLAEMSDESPPDVSVVETQQEPWTHFTDGSSCVDGFSDAGYDALIAGLRIAAQMGVQNIHVSVDSKLVANQVLGAYVAKEENMIKYLEKVKSLVLVEILKEKSIQEKEVTTVVEEDGPTWMTPIIEYLKEGTLPSDRKKASKLHIKDRQYELLEGVLYMRSFLTPWLRLGEGIKARLGEGNKNWIEELPHILWAHRTMIKSSHGDTPFSLTYETEAVIPAEIGMPTYHTVAVDTIHNDEELQLKLDLLEERRERAAIHKAKAKLKMTKYYNSRVRSVTFRPGDFVYHSNDASHAVDGGKLGPK
nr:reverse transcriptase domain-containing protein [Tanacetum cinerariifolium]